MENKFLVFGVLFLVLLLAFVVVVKLNKTENSGDNDVDLSKYRASNIPAECRLPDYQTDLNAWKEHLGHHENTRDCLKYYK